MNKIRSIITDIILAPILVPMAIYAGYKEAQLKMRVDELPRSKRQEVIDAAWACKTVAEGCKLTGLPMDVYIEIINRNVIDGRELRRRAL